MDNLIIIIDNLYGGDLTNTLSSLEKQTIKKFNIFIVSKNKVSLKKYDLSIKIFNDYNKVYNEIKKTNRYICYSKSGMILTKEYLEIMCISIIQNKLKWGFSNFESSNPQITFLYNIFQTGKVDYANLFIADAKIFLKNFSKINNTFEMFLSFISDNEYPVYINDPLYCNIISNTRIRKIKIYDEKIIEFPRDDYYDFDTFPKIFEYDNKKIININNKKKKLLFIFPWLVVGGADKFNLDLISGLDKNIFDITIVLTRNYNDKLKLKFEKYSSSIFDLSLFLERKDWAGFLDYIIKSRQIDLVFISNSLYGYHALPWLKFKHPNIPFVDYVHAEDWTWKNGGLPRDSNAVCNFLDTTYTCTNHLSNVMYNEMNRETKNIKPVYIGVDSNYYNPNKIDLNNYPKLIKYKENNIILFVCRLVHLKRPFFMLSLLKEMLKQDSSFVLFVVGDGECFKEMKKKAKRMGINESVVFFGNIEDVRPYYKIAKITLIPSLTEGLALVAYESLSMETPVISADVGGQKELIDETCGALVKKYQNYLKDLYNYDYSKEELKDYSDKINKIVYSSKYSNMCKNCRKKIVDKFDVKNMVDILSNDFLQLINKGSSVEKNFLVNEPLLERYLVTFNGTFYQSNPIKKQILLKQRIVNKLWKYHIYKILVKIVKKIKKDLKKGE